MKNLIRKINNNDTIQIVWIVFLFVCYVGFSFFGDEIIKYRNRKQREDFQEVVDLMVQDKRNLYLGRVAARKALIAKRSEVISKYKDVRIFTNSKLNFDLGLRINHAMLSKKYLQLYSGLYGTNPEQHFLDNESEYGYSIFLTLQGHSISNLLNYYPNKEDSEKCLFILHLRPLYDDLSLGDKKAVVSYMPEFGSVCGSDAVEDKSSWFWYQFNKENLINRDGAYIFYFNSQGLAEDEGEKRIANLLKTFDIPQDTLTDYAWEKLAFYANHTNQLSQEFKPSDFAYGGL
jgi:hypothetical protein